MPNSVVTPSRKLYSKRESTVEERLAEELAAIGQLELQDAQNTAVGISAESKAEALLNEVAAQKITIEELTRTVGYLEEKLSSCEKALADARSRITDYGRSIEKEKSDAYELAMSEGELAIEKEKEKLAEICQERTTEAVKTLFNSYRQIVGEAENTMVEIAFLAALKLFGEIHLANNNAQYRKYLVDMVHELTMNLSTWDDLRIHLSLRDYDIVVGAPDKTQTTNGLRNNIAGVPSSCFIKDDSIEPGGCKVDSVHGELDMRLERRILVLKNAILNVSKLKPL
jgi:flagellar biosynthesis/type III secretory pathway protein FliH